jgi:hypothetical protein
MQGYFPDIKCTSERNVLTIQGTIREGMKEAEDTLIRYGDHQVLRRSGTEHANIMQMFVRNFDVFAFATV